LIKELREFGKFLVIAGFRNVKIEDAARLLDLIRERAKRADIQIFDAMSIAGWEHLYFAALNALNAFKNGLNISKSLAVETILFSSAQRQIRKAIELMGVGSKTSEVGVLIIANSRQEAVEALRIVSGLIGGERDDTVLELTDKKFEHIRKLFNVSKLELEAVLKQKGLEKEALTNLMIERMALLAAQR